MSRFFRAKKKLVSMAGGSGAGRKIIKSHLGDDGVTLLRVLKTVTRKLHGKKQSRSLKKSLMKFAVKGGYLFKEQKLTEKDAKAMSLPMERLFKHGIDATAKDGEAAAAAQLAGETKSTDEGNTAASATERRESDSDEDEDDDNDGNDGNDDIPAIVASSSTLTAPEHLQPHIQGISEQLIALDVALKMMLKPHMKSNNISKLSKTVLFYSDLQWLTFFLTSDQCKEERISTHRIFSTWYETTFQPIVERRERRRHIQHQFQKDMSTNNITLWLSNPKRQTYLAKFLKNDQKDKKTTQLYRAINDIKTTTNRNMIKSRVPMVYNKYLNPSARTHLQFVIHNDIIIQLEKNMNENKFTKNMFDAIQTCIEEYVSNIMSTFLKSTSFSEFAKETYYVNSDGTPIDDAILDAEEEENEKEGKRRGEKCETKVRK